MIDEAQDYTAFQFAYLQRLFPFSRVTALGDLNQSIQAHADTEESTGSRRCCALRGLGDRDDRPETKLPFHAADRGIYEHAHPGWQRHRAVQPRRHKPKLTVAEDAMTFDSLIGETLTCSRRREPHDRGHLQNRRAKHGGIRSVAGIGRSARGVRDVHVRAGHRRHSFVPGQGRRVRCGARVRCIGSPAATAKNPTGDCSTRSARGRCTSCICSRSEARVRS